MLEAGSLVIQTGYATQSVTAAVRGLSELATHWMVDTQSDLLHAQKSTLFPVEQARLFAAPAAMTLQRLQALGTRSLALCPPQRAACKMRTFKRCMTMGYEVWQLYTPSDY